MERDRTHSGSSGSWSLVDSDGLSEADVDAIDVSSYSENTLEELPAEQPISTSPGVLNSSRDGSGRTSSRDGSQGTFDVPLTTDSEDDDHEHDTDESDIDTEADMSEEEEATDVTQSDSEQDEHIEEEEVDEAPEEASDDEVDAIVVDEDEAMEGESLRYVPPERVSRKLDALGQSL